MPQYQKRRTLRPVAAIASCALCLAFGACDFILSQPTIEGRWSGTALIAETSMHLEMDLVQTNLFKGWIHSITGSARCSFPEARLSVTGSIEGYYLHPDVQLMLETDGFAMLLFGGEVGKRDDIITGWLERGETPESRVPVTFHRE